MNQKTLGLLVGAVILLGGLYFATLPAEQRASISEPRRLFDDIDGQRVQRLKIEQGDKSLELAQKDGIWNLPSRGGYEADSAKVRSLLVKLFELTVSQRLPGAEGSFDKVGVSDEALKRGNSRVTLLDASGGSVGALRIGDARKGSRGALPQAPSSGGQYVRREGKSEVYLVPTPLSVSVSPGYWLDTELLNVLPNLVRSILLTRDTEGMSKVEFELSSDESAAPGSGPKLELVGGVPQGKELQEGVVSQIRSGLENVRFSDVFPKDAPEVKDLRWDWREEIRLENGLVYVVETAQSGDKYYARYRAQLNTGLTEKLQQIKDQVEKAAKEAPSPSPTPVATATAVPSAAATAAPSPAPTAAPTPKPISPATAADVEGLTKKLDPWVFELPAYQGKKYRQSIDDLVKVPAPPAPAGAPGAPGMGGPNSLPPGIMMGGGDDGEMAIPGSPEEFGLTDEESAPPAE